MKGRQPSNGGFKKGYDPNRAVLTPELKAKRLKTFFENRKKLEESLSFDEMSMNLKRKKILEEQRGACNKCKLSEWLGLPMRFELEHKNGNTSNNSRKNLEILCPNCHSFSPTWRKSWKNARKIGRAVMQFLAKE